MGGKELEGKNKDTHGCTEVGVLGQSGGGKVIEVGVLGQSGAGKVIEVGVLGQSGGGRVVEVGEEKAKTERNKTKEKK